jgi:protoheme IX farnesyltransferase
VQIMLYSLPMAAAAVAPWPLGLAGAVYGLAAVAFSLIFLALAFRVLVNRSAEPAEMKPEKQLFAFSILYLFVLFGALVADKLLMP